MRALALTLSYMVYDAASCHLNGDVRLDNTVHHLVSIVGIAAGLAYQRVRYINQLVRRRLPAGRWCSLAGL
jgi:hypothetical protein